MVTDERMKILTIKSSKLGLQPSLVDDGDFDRLSQYNYSISHYGYAVRFSGRQTIFLHQDVLGKAPLGLTINHINGNKLDNQKGNLRFCDRTINNQNKPTTNPLGFRGVQKLRSGRFQAKIKNHDLGKIVCLGTYNTVEDAAKAYDKAALKEFGEQAQLNFNK